MKTYWPHAQPTPTVLLLTMRLGIGGIERQIVELLKGLKRDGRFRSVLGVLTPGGELDSDAQEFADVFLPVQRVGRFDWKLILDLIKHVKRTRVDVIQTFDWMSCLVGVIVARWLKIPVIHSGVQSALPVLPIREKISYLCARFSDVVVANSYAGLKAYGLDGCSFAQVIYNGIDLQRFENVTPVIYDAPAICMVANFSRYKDHSTVIRAFDIVLKKHPDLKLVLVGTDLGTLSENQSLVAGLGIGHRVQFETQVTAPESIILGCKLAVLASTQGEGTSNAILEYMALRRPVVATCCDGNRELLDSGSAGLLAEAFSPEAMADHMNTLLTCPELADRMGVYGRQKIERIFDLKWMIKAHLNLYKKIMAKK